MFRKLSSIILVFLIIFLNSDFASANYGTEYFVSVNGSDTTGDGSFGKPFKTISFAAKYLEPGDVCYIREGTYRETIKPFQNGKEGFPITFQAYNNEKVTISGCDPVTGWTQHSGNIYVASMDWDMYNGVGNMVFADGSLCTEARWPNISDNLNRSSYRTITLPSTTSVADIGLPNIDYTGAVLWCNPGGEYWSATGAITGYNSSSKTIQVDYNTEVNGTIKAGSIYYVTRALGLLDAPGEWYKDKENNKLYFWAPDNSNPNSINVQAKSRQYAMDLSGKSHIVLSGINILGASVLTDDNTSNCTFDRMTIESTDYNLPARGAPSAGGFEISGSNNIIKNSEVKNNHGAGIVINGSNCKVYNNYIHDINYQNSYSDGIAINGEYQLVSHNTIYRTGRAAIGGTFTKSVVEYNDLYDNMKISKDGGSIYLYDFDYDNSEIHHNKVHDSNGSGFQVGIYYDCNTSQIITYNNLVYNIKSNGVNAVGLQINTPCNYNQFFNNTFAIPTQVGIYPEDGDLTGTAFINNLFSIQPFSAEYKAKMTYTNNLESSAGILNQDYTLNGSGGVDVGLTIPFITDGYTGSLPDMGAFEYGKQAWIAGHDFNTELNPQFRLRGNPYVNYIANRQFENNLDGWKVSQGSPEIFYQKSWAFKSLYTRQGRQALLLKAGDSISQEIKGLYPYTTYNLEAFARISGEFFGADSYSELSENIISANQYSNDSLTGFVENSWVEYENVDFESNIYNKMTFITKGITSGGKINVYLDSPTGTKIGTLNIMEGAAGKWEFKDISFLGINGTHTVYLVFSGTLDGAYYRGFTLNSSQNSDYITLSAVSDSGQQVSVNGTQNTDWGKYSTEVTTGELGQITLSVSKASGNYCGYVDSLALSCKYSQNLRVPEILINDIFLTDISGRKIQNVKDNEISIANISIRNNSDNDIEFNGILALYQQNGRLSEIVRMDRLLNKDSEENFGLGLTDINGELSFMKLFVWEKNSIKPLTYVLRFE